MKGSIERIEYEWKMKLYLIQQEIEAIKKRMDECEKYGRPRHDADHTRDEVRKRVRIEEEEREKIKKEKRQRY